MRSGYVLVGILLLLVAVPWFLAYWSWPVGVLFVAMGGILFYAAGRPEPTTFIMPVTTPSPSEQWHQATGLLPPPPQAPLPVVMRADPSSFFYAHPSNQAPFSAPYAVAPSLRACPQCHRSSPTSATFCAYCGQQFPS